MKNTCLLLAGFFAAAVTASAQVGAELIPNGDYSQLDDKGWPESAAAHFELVELQRFDEPPGWW